MRAGKPRNSHTTLWAVATLAGLLAAAPLAAVIMRALSLDELVESSDRVAVATVLSNESRWNDERTRIYTYTTVRVEEYLKGSGAAGDTLVIRTLGGAVGEMGLHVEGAPAFRLHDKEVIFLSSITGRTEFNVTGWNQGRFKVLPHPETGELMVVRGLAGTRMVATQGETTGSEFRAIRTLDDLRTAVRGRLRKQD